MYDIRNVWIWACKFAIWFWRPAALLWHVCCCAVHSCKAVLTCSSQLGTGLGADGAPVSGRCFSPGTNRIASETLNDAEFAFSDCQHWPEYQTVAWHSGSAVHSRAQSSGDAFSRTWGQKAGMYHKRRCRMLSQHGLVGPEEDRGGHSGLL
jgi:hypothetical protein